MCHSEDLLRFLKQCIFAQDENFSILTCIYFTSADHFLLKSCTYGGSRFLIYKFCTFQRAIAHFSAPWYFVIVSWQSVSCALWSKTVHSRRVTLRLHIFRRFRKPKLATIPFRERWSGDPKLFPPVTMRLNSQILDKIRKISETTYDNSMRSSD